MSSRERQCIERRRRSSARGVRRPPVRARSRALPFVAAGMAAALTAGVDRRGTAAASPAPRTLNAQSVGRFLDGSAGGKPIQTIVDLKDARATAAGHASPSRTRSTAELGGQVPVDADRQAAAARQRPRQVRRGQPGGRRQHRRLLLRRVGRGLELRRRLGRRQQQRSTRRAPSITLDCGTSFPATRRSPSRGAARDRSCAGRADRQRHRRSRPWPRRRSAATRSPRPTASPT